MKPPPLKEKGNFLPAVTCTITFRGEGQEKEVLLPYLRVSLGMAHLYMYTVAQSICSILCFSPSIFNILCFEKDLVIEHWP